MERKDYMITDVKLRGWKSHLDSDLKFEKGVNALIGIMGSGKSSVMQAISFAFFGTMPELQSRRILGMDYDLFSRAPHMEE